MTRDDRFYAFIVARTSRSRAHIRRICVHKRWLKASAFIVFAVVCASLFSSLYGFYGMTQQAKHLRIERENQRLRAENEKQRQQLQNLNNRVDAVEDTTRKLAEISGVGDDPTLHGQGGPAHPVDSAAALATLEAKTGKLESDLQSYADALRQRGMTPSLWPVVGRLESGVGGRHNPFTGRGWEYHEGQDIVVPYGTPVVAAGSGKVIAAGVQHGYGNVIYLDHGGELTTRYGHLSEIDVVIGQEVIRGEVIGKVGSTGRSTGPHLHYEVRIKNQPVNPRQYLPGAEQ